MVLPATDNRVGEKGRTREAALDRQLGRRRDDDLGLGVALAIFARELRLVHAHDDKRRRPALDRLGYLLADLLEGVAPVALDLLGHDLNVDTRQILGQRLAPRRFL